MKFICDLFSNSKSEVIIPHNISSFANAFASQSCISCAPSSSSRSQYGGFETMYHVAHFLRASSYPWHENSISPSLNPANFAERFADSTTSFLMSLEYILYSQSNCIDSALFFSSSNNHLGIQFQLS